MFLIPNGNKPRTTSQNTGLTKQIIQKVVRGKKGVSVIEILVVVFIIAVALSSIIGLTTFSLKAMSSVKEDIKAIELAQEAIEQVRSVRDGTSWTTNGLAVLSVGSSYYAEKSTTTPIKWQLIPGQETIGEFIRKIIFYNVSRDTNDNIVEFGGTYDPDTKKVAVSVLRQGKTIELESYFTNWK